MLFGVTAIFMNIMTLIDVLCVVDVDINMINVNC